MLGNINFNSLVQGVVSKAKALALNVTEIELKVLEATNEEPWGPHGSAMGEIARAAEDPEKYNLIMNVVSERLQMRDENWRLCYKALLLLEYLVKNGPWRVVDELNRSVSSLERLRDEFEYRDPQGKDHGINVRQRAGELAALVSNTDRVRQEREKAAKNANKYKGVSSSDMRGFGGGNVGGYGGHGSSSSGFGNGGGGFGSGSGGFGGGGGGGGYGGDRFGSGSGGFGSSSSRQAYPGTESVHMPAGSSSSHHSRTGSGSNANTFNAYNNPAAAGHSGGGFGGGLRGAGAPAGSGAGAGPEEGEDPFEATRKRIERLKAEGALPEPPPSAAPPGLAEVPAAGAKAPKKLSDIKINPAVAATFASMPIAPPPSGPTIGKLAPPPGAGGIAKPPPAAAASNTLDLFGELSGPAPSHAQPAAAVSAASDWDAFGSAPAAVPAPAAAPAAPVDPFAMLASGPVAPPATTSGGGASLLGGSSQPAAAAHASTSHSKPGVPPPLPFDDFAELPAVPPAPAAAFAARPAAPAADPFAALASSSGAGARPVATAPAAADPFAVLSASSSSAPKPMMSAAAAAPKPAVPPPLPFDAFGAPPAAVAPARTPQPAAGADPFAVLASGGSAPVARPAAPPAPGPAAAFDPFSPAPATMAAAPKAAASGFGDFLSGNSSSSQSAAAKDPFADPFAPAPAAPVFNAFPAPPAASGAASSGGAAMAMNKAGAAHGAAGQKSNDPFAGLGF